MGWVAGELWEPPAASAVITGTRLRSVTLFRLAPFSLAPILPVCSCHGSITSATTSIGAAKHIPSRRAEGRIPAQQSTAVPPTTPRPPKPGGSPHPRTQPQGTRGGMRGGSAPRRPAPLSVRRAPGRMWRCPRAAAGGEAAGAASPPPAPSHREPGAAGTGAWKVRSGPAVPPGAEVSPRLAIAQKANEAFWFIFYFFGFFLPPPFP